MKRIIALILVLLCMTLPALAEGIDIESMDLNDLLILHAKIDARIAELLACSVDTETIYQGSYTVGKDIIPGRYLLTCNKDTDDKWDQDFVIWLYQSEEEYKANRRLSSDSVAFEQSLSVTLEEGMKLIVVQGQAAVTVLPKPDWAP